MKFYTEKTVYEAAVERVAQIYEDFEHVIVATSGGKDSTVVLELCVDEARKRGRIPVDAYFLDQEGEHEGTIEYMEYLVDRPDVNLLWYQIPFILFNSAHPDDPWIHCWEPGHEWMRPRNPSSVKDNSMGTNRFYPCMDGGPKEQFFGHNYVVVQGMRAEESPSRRLTTVSTPRFRDWTWATGEHHETYSQYNMRPIYDWSYRDVWTAIERFGWRYNKTYDLMYRHGTQVNKMRVSNLTSNESTASLEMLHETERDTWEALTKRLGGVHMAAHAFELFTVPKELPEAFVSWREYRDYLLENLIREDRQEEFKRQFRDDWIYEPAARHSRTMTEISAILLNDYYGSLIGTWSASNKVPVIHRKKDKNAGSEVEAEGEYQDSALHEEREPEEVPV